MQLKKELSYWYHWRIGRNNQGIELEVGFDRKIKKGSTKTEVGISSYEYIYPGQTRVTDGLENCLMNQFKHAKQCRQETKSLQEKIAFLEA